MGTLVVMLYSSMQDSVIIKSSVSTGKRASTENRVL